jgi:hypothetical protein
MRALCATASVHAAGIQFKCVSWENTRARQVTTVAMGFRVEATTRRVFRQQIAKALRLFPRSSWAGSLTALAFAGAWRKQASPHT